MKAIELNKMGVQQMSHNEMTEVDGGNPILIGIGIGFGARALYDFVCGFYDGLCDY